METNDLQAFRHLIVGPLFGATCQEHLQLKGVDRNTVPTFNSCPKCMASPGEIHDRMPYCQPVSWAWMTTQLNVALINSLSAKCLFWAEVCKIWCIVVFSGFWLLKGSRSINHWVPLCHPWRIWEIQDGRQDGCQIKKMTISHLIFGLGKKIFFIGS